MPLGLNVVIPVWVLELNGSLYLQRNSHLGILMTLLGFLRLDITANADKVQR